MLEEINKLKKQNESLETKLTLETNKRKSLEEDQNEKLTIKMPRFNKYTIKLFRPTKKSFNDEQINNIFLNMKSIKDIIKLKDSWENIRHNTKLQKLHNIIPAIEKLDLMVGLNNIKNEIFKVIIYYIQNEHTDEYLHTVIYGPPGVGKTELAKIYSDIFVRLGILKSSSFVEIKKDDLVAKYLGQTSHRTKQLLEKSMGGVIFLDEAYSLGNEEKRDSFAKEAIDMINQYLSERKKDFMFIIAGYEDDLDNCFFSFNKGLKRRFSHHFKVEKYIADELAMIFKGKIVKTKYIFDDKTLSDDKIKAFFKSHFNKFENSAGDVEKFINYIKYDQSIRIFKLNIDNNIIILDDLNSALKNFKEKNNNIPYGLYV
jgi:SpoVK/Ycf46/Vps4 family AAA+-type ATPase